MRCSKSSSKAEFYSNTTLPQETRKNRTDNITLPLKQLEKGEPKNAKISRRKEIIMIRAEIDEKQMKETILGEKGCVPPPWCPERARGDWKYGVAGE